MRRHIKKIISKNIKVGIDSVVSIINSTIDEKKEKMLLKSRSKESVAKAKRTKKPLNKAENKSAERRIERIRENIPDRTNKIKRQTGDSGAKTEDVGAENINAGTQAAIKKYNERLSIKENPDLKNNTPWDDRELVDLVEAAGFAGVSIKELLGWKEKYPDFPKPLITKSVTGTEDAYDIDHIDGWLRKNKLIKPAKVISMINLKGGVGKTTTSVGLATILSGVYGKKVLFIDLDPQTNGTIMLIGEQRWSTLNKNQNTMASLFKDALDGTGKFDLDGALQKNVSGVEEVKGLDLLPSSIDLIDIQDRLITAVPGVYNTNNPVDILKRGIRPILYNYDYILIDCPPNMGLITQNGINISDSYIIPTIPDVLSTYGIPQIISRIKEFSNIHDHHIDCLGIVATKYKSNFSLHARTMSELKSEKDAHLFKTVFPENNQIAEAAEYQHFNTIRQKWGYQGQYDLLTEFAKEIIKLCK